MAVTDFDYIETRNEIIEAAFRIVGALDPGQSLKARMLSQGIKALQTLVKSWSNKGVFIWTTGQVSFSTVAGTEAYTASVDQSIVGVEKGWVVSSNEDLPLEVVSYSRYLDFYDKEGSSGRPQVVAFKPTPAPSIYVWPSPDAVYTVKLLSVYPMKDFDTASGTGDIPAKFQKALKYALAEDLFDEYPGPMNEREYIQRKAAILLAEARSYDLPVETTNEVEGLF